MRQLWVIARKDIRESFRSRTTYIYIVFLFLLSFSNFSTFNSQTANGSAFHAALIQASQNYLDTITYTMPLWYAILISTVFATYSVIVEKAKRNLESLMATPISLNKIWMGKSLAVALPSSVIALGVSLVSFIIINLLLLVPRTGVFMIPNLTAIISAVFLVPLLIFTVAALVIYIQLIIANPRLANFVFIGVFLLFFFGANFLNRGGLTVNFSLIYSALVILCGALAFFLSRTLTKERVILSSKD
jgi:ABC-type Na+ efflux pump permease subunit